MLISLNIFFFYFLRSKQHSVCLEQIYSIKKATKKRTDFDLEIKFQIEIDDDNFGTFRFSVLFDAKQRRISFNCTIYVTSMNRVIFRCIPKIGVDWKTKQEEKWFCRNEKKKSFSCRGEKVAWLGWVSNSVAV